MSQDRSTRAILVFWFPLALQWVMMALEGPFLAAVIARLPDPAFNLAAYGVAFAFAILVESPVIMLMSASTALVEDGDSYRKLRRFAWALNLLSTLLLLLILIPPVFRVVMLSLVGLPEPVAELAYGALWLLLPWPAAIGYRRFLHGVLIRSGRTRRVAYGTGIRLLAMALTALLLARAGLPGVWVGAAALSAGVVVEALVARWMAAGVVRALLDDGGEPGAGGGVAVAHPVEPGSGSVRVEPQDEAVAGSGGPSARGRVASWGRSGSRGARSSGPGSSGLDYPSIARFYYPLALTSFIGLTTQPLLTFFMGRSPFPVESLALFPVVMGLTFLFNALGLSFQEAAIALVGRKGEHARELARFAVGLALAGFLAMAALTFTPLADLWFSRVAGLPPELAELAVTPARVAVLLPALAVVLAFQRALLVQARDTRPITLATALEVSGIALLFPVLGWGLGWMGVTAAFAALLGGRIAGVAFLTLRTLGRRGGTAR